MSESLADVVHEAVERAKADEAKPVTLTEFLLARIAEDEAAAQNAAGGYSLQWTVLYGCRIEDGDGNVIVYDEGSPTEEEAAHITRHDPARVLAECEAKRRIVAELGDYDDGYVWASGEGSRARTALEALAQPHAEHPDFDPSWRL